MSKLERLLTFQPRTCLSFRTHAQLPWLARAFLVATVLLGSTASAETLTIKIVDEDGDPLPSRIHLKNSRGEVQLADLLPSWNDHFVCDGQASVEVQPGKYRYEIERGPEYAPAKGDIEVQDGRAVSTSITLKRIANLREQGWFSADLHVHRPANQIELLMKAEDLDFAPVITWWNRRNLWRDRALPSPALRQFDNGRLYHLMAGEDERGGGALLYFGLSQPLKIDHADRESPSPLDFVQQARDRQPNVWIDIEKPFWWDVPIWIASGQANSIGIANNHMCRSTMLPNEAWGKPRDAQRLPAPRGNGFWTQEIYYHLLNSGIRIPPSAGSASGVLPNPVGYNRVYVQLDQLHRDRWWQGLAEGRCFVTNGPLLICRVNERLPGTVFRSAGEPIEMEVQLHVTSTDTIPAIEVIQNGRVTQRVPCRKATTQALSFGFSVKESGWFLIRALTDRAETFRFASTGPYYVEVGDASQRISKKSAEFFLNWVHQRARRLEKALPDPQTRQPVMKHVEQAREFWSDRISKANQP